MSHEVILRKMAPRSSLGFERLLRAQEPRILGTL